MQQGLMDRMLNSIERVGNRLPDPVTLFIILIAILLLTSAAAAFFGLSAQNPMTGQTITAVNLLSGDQIRRLLVEMPQIFASFPPLATVLLAMLGVGIAERSGLIGTALSTFVRRIPASFLTPALLFAGIMSSLAADAGYVILIPLGGLLFLSAGRNPIVGIAATFAAVSAGFSANLLLTPMDALMSGITQDVAQIITPGYTVSIAANYYLMAALVVVFVAVGTAVTHFIIEPRFGHYTPPEGVTHVEQADQENSPRGLRWAAWTGLVFLIIVAALTIPNNAVLRAEDGSLEPFFKSLVSILFFGFLSTGLAYGIGVGTIRNDRDAVAMAGKSMSDMGLYIVLAFIAAHFIALFNWSNLGALLSISAASGLQTIGLTGVALAICLILLVGFINLFIGSASAKWALLAPTFVPMMILLGYSPELTQAIYRIGDAYSNIITPLMPYFPMVLVFTQRYAPNIGIGGVVAMMIPYSIAFGVASTAMLMLWMVLDIPLGPDVLMYVH